MMPHGMFRVMTASPRVYLAEPAKNLAEISALLAIADAQGAQLCVLPELCLTGSTCGDLFYQHALKTQALRALDALTALPVKTAFVVSLPLEIGGRLFSCAVVVCGGKIAGVVPKRFPIHDADGRWFAPAHHAPQQMQLLGSTVPVGCDLCFAIGEAAFGVVLGGDVDLPGSPAEALCLGGAQIIAHPCAQPEIAGSHAHRMQALAARSAQLTGAFAHACAGYGESSTDMTFSGCTAIYENGHCRKEGARFAREAAYAICDVDVQRLRFKRTHAPAFAHIDPPALRMIALDCAASPALPLLRPLPNHPFIPQGDALDARCEEILMIQTQGLLRRMDCVRTQKAVLGVSGGLDSTLTLLAAALAFDRAGWDRKGIIGITMPGFGTGSRTKSNAETLMEEIGCTMLTIPIGPAVMQHFADIGQSAQEHNICYENSQARERTQIVMDYANKVNAIALGTGDLSELALGWCTYGGDQMSMYNMSGGVPKTLLPALVRHAAAQLGDAVLRVSCDVIDTPISPELIPSKEGELNQRTEDALGAYALHDFFIWHTMDSGASPERLFALACIAFDGAYSREAIHKALLTFIRRFFTQQFKRSCMPDGPKVGSVSLSPRGDWRMPSDALFDAWLEEAQRIEVNPAR